jgi:hypothetical protein
MKHITLRVLCEGLTESNFVSQVLMPHLRQRLVFPKAEPLRPRMYGVVSFEKLRNAIKYDVGRSGEHEYVTTMIDLYKIGRYPGVERLPNETPIDRVRRIEHRMAEALPNPRFIPYVQLHEFETLVLVDPDRIPDQFPDGEAAGAPARLRAEIGDAEPELVNDGEQTAPSKRIIRIVPAYAPMKAVAGPAVAGSIGLVALRAKCPHFDDWLRRLERLSE